MKKAKHLQRFWAFLLAFVLVSTTIASDGMRIVAAEGETATEQTVSEPETTEQTSNEGGAASAGKNEQQGEAPQVEEGSQTDGNTSDGSSTPDSSSESTTEGSVVESGTETGLTEEAVGTEDTAVTEEAGTTEEGTEGTSTEATTEVGTETTNEKAVTYVVSFNVPEKAIVKVNGEIVSSTSVEDSSDLQFTVETEDGYRVKSVKAGSNELTASDGSYVLNNVTEDIMVEVEIENAALMANAEERVINVGSIVITNEDEAAELTAGDTIELAYEITPADATDKSVTWTSSDNSVATVDENGKVTAVAEGTAAITVKTADGEATDAVDVNVKNAVIAVEKVKIEGADIVILNSKISLSLIVEPENAEIGEINWSSANEEVATVDNKGTVTGKAEGIVEIIVSVDGKEAYKDITVIDPSSVKPVHTLTINYVYGEDAGTMAGRKAADTYYADVREGGSYKRTSPIIVGYQAEPEVIQGIMPENDLSVTVTYHPTETSYTVQHRFEQLDGSYVTENEVKRGMYGTESEAEAKTVKGYEAGVVDNAIIGKDTVIVIEYTRLSYTVRFNSAGGSYVTAIEALYETPITLGSAQNPTRAGYIFDGWLNENGEKVTNLTLTENMLLTAAWKVDPNATANYKIIYWVQKAEGNEYDFLYSITKKGSVGHTINSTDIPDISKSELSKINLLLEGFKRSKIDTDKIIQIDDSTIVNVYYDRKEFNLKFYNNKEDRNPVKTIIARYGAWINDWPSDNLWRHFDGWKMFNTYAGMSTMPAENMNFFRVDTGKNSYKIYYMVEPIEGNDYIVHHIDSFTSSKSGWTLAEEDRYPITGFTLNPNDKRNKPDVGGYLNQTSSGKRNEIYYTRNSYLIEFSANGGYNAPGTNTYKYEAVITKPSGTPIREGYDFIGWYYDPGATSRVEWGKDTMPANNMTVYAGWKIKTYPVVFDENYENGKTETTKVDYNHTVNEPQAPERDGYNFLGWFTQPEGGVKYDFGTPVKNGFTLYAHWSPKNYTSYTVKYLEQGTDNILHDQKVVSNQRVGKTVTEWAVDLEASGYVAVQASQSMILAQSENVITFYYTNAVERNYTVTGIDRDTKEVIYGPEGYTTKKAAVWISAPEIKGYVLVEGQAPSIYRDIYLDAEKNKVVFEYERQKITYSVNYYVGGNYMSDWSETYTVKDGTQISNVEDKCPAGYHLDKTVPDIPTTITSSNRVINVYYVENAAITINYEARTGGSVSKASETLAPVTGIAEGSTATASAGYHFVNWTDKAGKIVNTEAAFKPEKVEGLNVEATYYANFEEDEDITITYVAEDGGTVTSSSETLAPATGVAKGSEAEANPGYHFVSWTNEAKEVVSTDVKFTPDKVDGLNVAATYYANFEENESITINYVARTGGSVNPSSETLRPATDVATGSSATAAAGYEFVNWTNKAGEVVGTDEVFVPEKVGGVNVAATYYANFAEKEEIVINYQADKNGIVDRESEKLKPATGEAVGSVATPNQGYKLVNWTNSKGEAVSTDTQFIPAKVNGLNVPETYTAHFEKDESITKNLSYTVEYWVEGEGTARDSYVETAKVWINDPDTLQVKDIEMKVYPGYSFTRVEHVAAEKGFFQWLKSLIPSDKLPETVGNGDTIKIIYTEDDVTIQYKADENGSVGLDKETIKAVTGNAQGSTATADNGYHFVNWTNEAGTAVSSDSNFVPDKVSGVNVAATYTAHFAENDKIVITYIARTGGSVDLGSEELAPATGTAQGSTASEDAGYTFVNWTNEAGDVVGTEPTFVPDKKDGAYEEATYYANFVQKADVTINYEAKEGGRVEPANETLAPATGVAQGSVATAEAGYHFVSWTNEANEVVGTKAAFVPQKVDGVNVAATYYANFEEDEDITINYVARLGGSVTPESEELAPATGVAAGSTAAVSAGYHFVNWTDANGNEVGTDVKFVPEKVNGVNVAATYYANFSEDEDVTINYVANVGGSVNPEEETLAPATGNAVGSVAAVMSGYHFVNWTNEAGEEVGTELEFIPAKVNGVNVAATYYANFEENEAIDIQYVARIGGSVNPGNETLAPATGVAVGSTAMADTGYHFVNWTNEADEEVGTDLAFVPEKVDGVNVAATYYANFEENENIVINYVTDGNGTVSAASESLAPVTGEAQGSTATANGGYHFVNWTNEAGDVVSTDAAFVPAKVDGLNVAATYTAHFAANPAPTPEDPDPNPNPNPTPDTTPSTTGVLGEALPPAQPEVGVLGEAAGPEVGVLGESKGPGTGDTAPIAGWSFLIMGAVLTLGITAKRRKKDEK